MPLPSAMEYLRTVLLYLTGTNKHLTATELREAIVTSFPKQQGVVMSTLGEQWMQEGMEKGLQQGRQEGRQQGRQEGRQQGRQEGRQEGRQQVPQLTRH